jgi:phenylpropionate dioxygenase-like ring-hydroxylating dioxygenase large terminal subunit
MEFRANWPDAAGRLAQGNALIAKGAPCGFIYVNLDLKAAPLKSQTGDLETEIRHWAPDIDQLTFGHWLTYDIKSNWKNVVNNFLECYHCPTAHKDFCRLVDMNTYKVTTHGIYSSHMADAGQSANSAYDVSRARIGQWRQSKGFKIPQDNS